MEATIWKVIVILSTTAVFITGRTTSDNKYRWIAQEWSTCYVPQGCGDGTRQRDVWCSDKNGDKVHEYFCRAGDEPQRTRDCFTACRHHKDHLEWKMGEWGPCLTSDNEIGEGGETGKMERNVSCILTSHDHVQVSMVIDEDNCLVVGDRPETIRGCILPSRQECVLTEWSEWTPCCDATQHRTRSVLVAPHYGAQPCPQLSEWKSCEDEDSDCQPPSGSGGMRLRVEKWGECRPSNLHPPGDESDSDGSLWDGDSRGQADNYYKHWPQVGTQQRTVTCLNPAGLQVDITECLSDKNDQGLPMRERACIISQDCAISEWSEWTVVQEGCIDPNGNEWVGITERHREILRLHEGQGKSCPHLIETKETKSNLPLCSHKFHWVTSKWSECTLPGVLGLVVCGGGLQFRNITCVKADGGQPLPSKQCLRLPPPPTVQRCEVACPRDCEVSQWGPWGPCTPYPDTCSNSGQELPQPLSRHGQRLRKRNVVVAPSELGLGCPSLVEVQPCLHPKCYLWKTGQWSSCYLNNNFTKCGAGTRNRKVTCVTHSGDVVPNSFCSDLMPDVEESCLLPCPYDCIVSGWSAWSPCSQPCSTPTSLALRSRNRTIIAPPGHDPRGYPCPDPDEFMQIEGCNTHGCHGYSWMTLPWQECNATCGDQGFQIREVWCSENQEQVPDERCTTLLKPTDIQECSRKCPAECEVSPWSEWSKCDVRDCYTNETKGLELVQTRYRVVLEGKDCGPLVEEAPCPLMPSVPCPTYKWATGNWSHCQLAAGVRCGHGLRTRDLWCIKDDAERVELRHCLATEDPIPVSVQRCHSDCHTPCQLTEWSPWSACKVPCQGFKGRTRELIGLSWQHSTCKELALTETMPCPCAEYFPVPLSDWSSCLTNESIPCGTGMRYRAMGCLDKKQQMVDPGLCGGSNGLQEEPCFVPCPIDCKLGEWTAWNDCDVQCGPGVHNRTRKIERTESHGGRPCGSTVETKVCNTSCDVFQWQAGGWSECTLLPLDRRNSCGAGDQYRQVRCFDTRSNQQVDDAMCDWTTRPLDTNACHVACPGDCVLSPWSEWSFCPKGCLGNAKQQRTRSLLRAAAKNGGANCPRAIQTQECILNITCFTYKWMTTNYSSCLPLGGSPCGEGMATRAIYCLRSDNRPVADSWCSDMVKPAPAEKWCYTDCPVDCELAQWSEWNASACQCGQTGMSRHAIIATNPSSSGRPCPDLLQWKPCPATPCYSWQPSPWSPCQLHGAACGHGVRVRNVSCVRGNDNTTVEPWHCSGTAKRPSLWEPCHSPCDSDCQLSKWSEWSHCHADCTRESTGYQTRSRAVIRPPQSAGAEPCPEALWETRPCDHGPCYTFDWTVTSTGNVICQRSDGLHVVGGCNGKKKPKIPSCQWTEGQCVCEDGAVVLQQTACTSENNEVQSRIYFPNDDLSVWMFAMIGIGCVFIIFVAASIYLLCQSGRDGSALGYQQNK